MKLRFFSSLLVCSILFSVPADGSPTPSEQQPKKCRADFVDGIGHGHDDCNPQPKQLSDRCELTLYKLIYPGSEYDSVNGRKKADAELKRAVDYYAKYCIDLKIEEVTFTADEKKKAKRTYQTWVDTVIQNIGGKDHLGKTSLKKGDCEDFKQIVHAIQKQAEDQKPKGKKLVVVFMNEYIGGGDGRDTLVSSCQESTLQIGINWVDADSPYILSHELIHAIGKPTVDSAGNHTWNHDSKCKKALSTITRVNARTTVDLSDRFLDVTEYDEFGTSRCAKLMKCKKIQ